MTQGDIQVPLGELLTRSTEVTDIQPDHTYRQVTVRLWGRGAVLRREVPGTQISAPRQFIVRDEQFLISRIDARNGACSIVPNELDGAVVSNDFPSFIADTQRLLPAYLGWISKTRSFVEDCKRASEGTTNRVRLQKDRFLEIAIPLPPLAEQRRIVAKIEALAGRIEEGRSLRRQAEIGVKAMLASAFHRISDDAAQRPMSEVAPLVRRPVEVQPDATYKEIGIRCFGKGTFHKAPIDGLSLGNKRVFHIHPSDLLFNVVFAWEGAVAVASARDEGRVGSHRFLTCIPAKEMAMASYLGFYFLTPEGLERLGHASPGGAGRNRTLGIKKLECIRVPVPPVKAQRWFDRLLGTAASLRTVYSQTAVKLDALLPSILDKAFKGEL